MVGSHQTRRNLVLVRLLNSHAPLALGSGVEQLIHAQVVACGRQLAGHAALPRNALTHLLLSTAVLFRKRLIIMLVASSGFSAYLARDIIYMVKIGKHAFPIQTET